MMKEIEALGGESYETRGLKIKKSANIDKESFLLEAKKIKTKEDALKVYGLLVENPEFYFEKLENFGNYYNVVNQKYEMSFKKMKLSEEGKRQIFLDALEKYNFKTQKNLRTNAMAQSCINDCNWDFQQRMKLCESDLSAHLLATAFSSAIGTTYGVGLGLLVVGGALSYYDYYSCNKANDLGVVSCLNGCEM